MMNAERPHVVDWQIFRKDKMNYLAVELVLACDLNQLFIDSLDAKTASCRCSTFRPQAEVYVMTQSFDQVTSKYVTSLMREFRCRVHVTFAAFYEMFLNTTATTQYDQETQLHRPSVCRDQFFSSPLANY